MKRLSILIALLILQVAFAAVPQEDYYSVGSDFMILQNPENTASAPPQFYALYPDTNIQLDINNDGSYDYKFKVNSGGPNIFTTSWPIAEGTKVHSDKPIQYLQAIYSINRHPSLSISTYREERIMTIPPIPNWKNEYVLRSGRWYILSDSDINISVDRSIDGSIDDDYTLNKTGRTVDITAYSRVYSDKKFIAYSKEGLAGVLSDDFLSNENKTYLIIPQDSTTISVDNNIDGIIDSTSIFNKGEYNFTVSKPARISSDKNFSAFRYVDGLTGYTVHSRSYIPLPMTDSVSDEFVIAVNNDFIWFVGDRGHSLIGIFNNDSYPGADFIFNIRSPDKTMIKGYNNFTTGKTQTMGSANGFFVIDSSAPLLDHAYSYYSSGSSYLRYYVGQSIAYRSAYITTSPKSRIITNSSSVKINSRVFNTFNHSSVKNVKVKFYVNDYFSMPVAVVNGRKVSLADDMTIDIFSTPLILRDGGDVGDGKDIYFLFEYPGSLDGETYLDLDFDFMTPKDVGAYIFKEAELSYTAPTWII